MWTLMLLTLMGLAEVNVYETEAQCQQVAQDSSILPLSMPGLLWVCLAPEAEEPEAEEMPA